MVPSISRFTPRRRSIALVAATVLGTVLMSAGGAAARSELAVSAVTPGPTVSGNYLAARHARLALEEGDAADFLLAALKTSPDDPALLARVLPALLLSGRVPEAVVIAERFPPNAVTGPAELTRIVHDIKQKRFSAAMERLQGLPTAPHTDVLVPLLLAWSEYGQGRLDDALRRLAPVEGNRGLSLLFSLHAAWMNAAAGRPDAAADLIHAVFAEHKEPWLRLVNLGGLVLERAGRREEALAVYREYQDRQPDTDLLAPAIARATAGKAPPPFEIRSAEDGAAEALFDAVGIVSRQNNRETALIMGRLGLYLRPDFPALQVVVADLLEGFQRYRDANRLLAEIDRGSPLVVPAKLSIARNLQRLDQFDDAAAMLETLARQRPRDAEPLIELGDMYRKRERYAEAVEAYDRAFARIGAVTARHWRLLYVRGIALERTKDWPRAEADFLKALEYEPDQPAILNYLGYSWVEQGIRLEEAEQMIRKAVSMRPNDGYIVDSLGWVLFRLGRAEEAVEHMERAVELRPEDPIINDHLGDVYQAVGRYREARFQWAEALQLKPEPDLKAQIEAKLGLAGAARAETPPR
jgi:tetratricopeptide (TPR) repeat protein